MRFLDGGNMPDNDGLSTGGQAWAALLDVATWLGYASGDRYNDACKVYPDTVLKRLADAT